MYCVKKITDELTWVGANDRRLAMFEGVYSVPKGVSYNSYLLCDDKTVLFDTVDKAVTGRFLENLSYALSGRDLDYIIVQHMEPDHSAALGCLVEKYPGMKIVCNEKTLELIKQFHEFDVDSRVHLVAENDTLNTGRHTLSFVMAPMVHWPEVMVTYDITDKILFSADAFGCFGALNGALYADEVDFGRDYMDEARRYYTNIVGKYGTQVEALLKKASGLAIDMICPLHGFVWRSNIGSILSKYTLWSRYEPEERGVMIAYASVYGNTENAAELLACRLRNIGIKTEVFDVSVTPASEIIAAAFKWSHLVFASTTYNAGIFVAMEALINDLVAHNIQNRTVAVIENGSWAATSGGLIRESLEKCKDIRIIEQAVSIRSGLKAPQLAELEAIATAIASDFPRPAAASAAAADKAAPSLDPATMFKLTYGLFVLTARDGGKDNGCIINTVTQVTDTPCRISVAVNKANLTHDMIAKTGEFNVSILTENAPFDVFKQFGFSSGRDSDKFAGLGAGRRSANGIRYLPEHANGVISAKVAEAYDYGTHTLFIADVTQSFALTGEPSVTYRYYFEHIKPKPQPPAKDKKGYVCKICGYVHEGDTLPADFICPLCKHGAQDFEPIGV
ncbi:MAG: flavin reductase [Chitinispirillales bacterium]|jgi:flavorubredoxin/flavin reductase (DIM6/NTAB) family NADH-FMN oxidoreductase RutF|nr:flavin reductase [Chitinispirillales bacterium]